MRVSQHRTRSPCPDWCPLPPAPCGTGAGEGPQLQFTDSTHTTAGKAGIVSTGNNATDALGPLWNDFTCHDGQPETIRYHLLVPLLLNELQRQQAELASQAAQLTQVLDRLATLDATRPTVGPVKPPSAPRR